MKKIIFFSGLNLIIAIPGFSLWAWLTQSSTQYRSTWTVDAATGEYSASFPSPTGIPSDPALTGYGEDQSKQLADRILSLHPSVDVIYSSPYYRCLQTIRPVMQRLPTASKTKKTVRVEYGLRYVRCLLRSRKRMFSQFHISEKSFFEQYGVHQSKWTPLVLTNHHYCTL